MVEKVRVFGEWAIGTIWTEDRKELKITGEAVSRMLVGREYTVRGNVRMHPKHGESFEVVAAELYIRPNESAITRFISETFRGIGQKTAQKYVKAVRASDGEEGLEAVRQKLLKQPWTVAEDISRVTRKKGTYEPDERDGIVQSFVERDLATKLGGAQGIRDSVIRALAKYLVESGKRGSERSGGANEGLFDEDPVGACWAHLIRDPYAPIKDVPGFGFVMADAIGKSVNIPIEAPQRLAALVAYAALQECAQYGHVYLTQEGVCQAIERLDHEVDPIKAIAYALEQETVALDGDRLYPFEHLEQERSLAKLVANMMVDGEPLSKLSAPVLAAKVQEVAYSLGGAFRDGLDPTQVKSLVSILTSSSRIHTVTAGPGCGKTALMEVLVKVLNGHKPIFCSPTGKGAKVLGSRIARYGLRASTLHSLLRGSGPGQFQVNEDHPLKGDFMVVDEAGMIDLGMMASVLEAVPPDMHVILLGDDQQLPSIGAGRVLGDLLEVDGIDHNRLSKTHRNSGGILDVVNEVKSGRFEPTDRDGVKFSHELGDAQDKFPQVMSAYLEAVGRLGFENVSMLMSRKKGDPLTPGWNTTYANACLRQVCNPSGEKVPGTRFSVGDRIIIRENIDLRSGERGVEGSEKSRSTGPDDENQDGGDLTVVNGDTGQVVGYTKMPGAQQGGVRSIKLKLDDGRLIEYPGESASSLDHSYAMTVHSAQGSEYQEVIAVVTGGMPSFINRSTIFTAFSRPKQRLHVFAEDAHLRRIASTPAPHRNSMLVGRIAQELQGQSDVERCSLAGQSQAMRQR